MKNISSRNNPKFKEIRLLVNDSQIRRKANLSILEGVHLCETALQREVSIQSFIVAEGSLNKSEIIALLEKAETRDIEILSIPDEMMAQLTLVDSMPGVMALMSMPQPVLPEQFVQTVVVLDALQDPGNVGSILRTACAAGIQHIVCGLGTVSAWSPKVLRAAMGAHFYQTIYEKVDLATLLPTMTLPILATSSHSNKSIYESSLNRPVIWLLGNEGQGVADELMGFASELVTIPQQSSIESMNVAASAAICFFEQVRQLKYTK